MLSLIYDIKCGFKELYITEKNLEEDLSYICSQDMLARGEHTPTEEEYYNQLRAMDQIELEEELISNGTLGMIEENAQLDYAHNYFKDICFADKNSPAVPGYVKIYNLRIKYDPTVVVKFEPDADGIYQPKITRTVLKAGDVMAILGISRQTLSRYVKEGKVKVKSRYNGGQYQYDAESVYALKK